MTCLTDSEVLAFVAGDLPSEPRQHAELHLNACSMCLGVVAEMGRVSAAEPCGIEEAVAGPRLANGEPRYVPGPEIARGGMGRILTGEDRLLGRPVALKLLRRSCTSLARRFLREQQITARLQHPAIVPVYDAGVQDDGEPFFVMRLVKGQSLDRCAVGAASLKERLQLLPAVLGVVDAVAYAHGEGVVHRDLKPQNVLVGPFGEVVVLDWGLARDLGAGTDFDIDDVDSGDSDDRHVTRDGERLGTVAYMAPEQAAGQPADARSDVYGLGAILYHVLTGRPPHAERTMSLSTKAVLHAAPPLPLLAPDVPQDLVAIVARAMAPEPGARYASALELAADLKRWQAGRLVEAHRYSPGELLRRFMRRYRAPLLVGAIAVIVLVVIGGVGLWRIFAERRHALTAQAIAEDAQAIAEDARRHAETQRVAAEKLVAFILDDLRPRVERIGRLDALADVARAVMAYQDSAPAEADAQAWLRRAQASALAGDLALDTGDVDAAEESYRRSREAIKTATDAGATASDTDAVTLDRCRATIGLGNVARRRGNWAEAASYYEATAALARGATEPNLQLLYLRGRLGMALSIPVEVGDSATRRRILEETLAEAGAQSEVDDPDDMLYRTAQQIRLVLWQDMFDGGELTAAREIALAHVALARVKVDAGTSAENLHTLADGLLALARSAERLGDRDGAQRACQESLDLSRLLVAQDPSNKPWQWTQIAANMLLAELLEARGQPRAALSLKQSVVQSWERRAAASPMELAELDNLSRALLAKGDLLQTLGRRNEARTDYQRAIDILTELIERAPGGHFELGLSIAIGNLAGLELGAKRIAVGQAHLRRCIDLLRQALAARDTPQIRGYLAEALATLAESERGPAAPEHIDEAVELLKPHRGHPLLQELLDHLARAQQAIHARH